MCAQAALHARVRRVVFGATEPKTGAAGSVIDLFALPQLNHQTQVASGVLADECAAALRAFFSERRAVTRAQHHPLREDALRTPESRFAKLAYPWTSHHISDLPSLAGWRLHFLDEGPTDAAITWLCLHSSPAWSYLFRHMIPVFLAAQHRVVAPDLIGFGKSDKPKKENAHSLAWHSQVLREWVARLDLQRVVLVHAPDDPLALALAADAPAGWMGSWALPRQVRDDPAGLEAPFPDHGHRAGPRAFARLAPACDAALPIAAHGPHTTAAALADAARAALSHFSR